MPNLCRLWRAVAKAQRADDYVAHLRAETIPALERIDGFVDLRILRRDADEGVEFLIVTEWTSIDAIRAFAGDDVDRAVVPERVDAMLIGYERVVRHYTAVD